ncbi:MAG TPA: dTMP kinase [Rhizomicrobium sp.]|jgi:dTMP kinase
MNPAPRFITFEGGEGTGKSTQTKRLAAALSANGIEVVTTREPGGSPGAEDVRKLVVEGEPGRWDALTETLLMFAARTDHLARTIRPALARGQWVLCDRFTDSTFVYQGAGRGLDAASIAAIDRAATTEFRPDLTLVLDLPVETGLARARARHASNARFERFDDDFHARMRMAFRALAEREPERCVLIDATQPIDAVAADIWKMVAERFSLSTSVLGERARVRGP